MQRRELDDLLQPITGWTAFDATVNVTRLLEGNAFLEVVNMHAAGGMKRALGSRFYNPGTNQWTIFWANEDDHQWQPPMRGGMLTGEGIDFVAGDTFGGRHVLARYRWNTLDRDRPTWEQSFSSDNGQTWTSNWIMRFERAMP